MENMSARGSFPATCDRRKTSSKVVESRIPAVASLTSFISRRTPQVLSSLQSLHLSYDVLLTHGRGASGPSNIRKTCPTEMRAGAALSVYPPPFPFLLRKTPWFFSSSRISSRNRRGIFSRAAISEISNRPFPYSRLKANIAFRAYLVLCDSIRQSLAKSDTESLLTGCLLLRNPDREV